MRRNLVSIGQSKTNDIGTVLRRVARKYRDLCSLLQRVRRRTPFQLRSVDRHLHVLGKRTACAREEQNQTDCLCLHARSPVETKWNETNVPLKTTLVRRGW